MADSRILSGIILVLGIVIVGLGCHAYFESGFNKENSKKEFHEICKLGAKCLGETCPSSALELYFVIVSIIAVVISGALFIGSFLLKDNKSFKTGDSALKALTGVLVLIGGITVIVSAVQANGLQNALLDLLQGTVPPTPEMAQCFITGGINNRQSMIPGVPDIGDINSISRNDLQYYDEKIAAGALSLLNGVICIVAAVIGFRS